MIAQAAAILPAGRGPRKQPPQTRKPEFEKSKEMTEKNSLSTLDEKFDSVLAVVAHPDDLEYGAASAIARWTALGKRVAYLLITRGEAGIDGMAPPEAGPAREAEQRASAAVCGVSDVEFLDYTDGVVEYGLGLRLDIARAIRKFRPEAIVTNNFHLNWGGPGGPLNMADHRNVGLAALDAARDAGNRWIFTELLEEGAEPWNGVKSVLLPGSHMPTHAVDVTGYEETGVASLQAHALYIKGLGNDFDPETFITMSLAGQGAPIGADYGVSFEVVPI
jgi:LmbE family N-acetylglucosaminyl deacetylase